MIKGGEEWKNMRAGDFSSLEQVKGLSENFKQLLKSLMRQNPKLRPNADEILKLLPDPSELELKWTKLSNSILRDKFLELKEISKAVSTKNRKSSL